MVLLAVVLGLTVKRLGLRRFWVFLFSLLFGVTYTEPHTKVYECEKIYLYLAS